MKKVLFVSGLIALMIFAYGCGKKPPPPVEQPAPVVDTTTPPPPPPPPVQPPPQPQVKEIKDADFSVIYFDFDKYNIRADQRAGLDNDARLLKENPGLIIKIEGNCDERGTVEYNLGLGDRRAMSVKNYLIDLGISADRIETISYGKERPVDPGHNEDAWAKNRRADFRVIKR
jgi:peptidoglycan-associated lipoprotein